MGDEKLTMDWGIFWQVIDMLIAFLKGLTPQEMAVLLAKPKREQMKLLKKLLQP
jgi:hypothetical protein